jgi:hypothetical protein
MKAYNPNQKYWDEAEDQNINRQVHSANSKLKFTVEQSDYDPKDYLDNLEYDNHFHICWLCGKSGFDDDMRKNNIMKWVHIDCELQMEETIKHICHE